MQIKVILQSADEFSFPYAYNYQLQSAIYRTLRNSSKEFSDMLHGEAGLKLFTFSQFEGDIKAADGKLNVKKNGKLSFELRSPSETLCNFFKDGLLNSEHLKLFDRNLDIKLIDSTDKHIFEEYINISARSPVIAMQQDIESRRSYFYSPDNDIFPELVEDFLSIKYNELYPYDEVYFKISNIRKVRKCVTRYKSIWMTGYYFTADLTGSPRELDLAYNIGIGNCTSKGFGMFDIIDNN